MSNRIVALLAWARDPGTDHPAAGVLRLAAGLVFLGFGPGKFRHHEAEASAFERYGIPFPEAATYAVGALELAGGAALLMGLLVRPVALVLASNLFVAVATAGRHRRRCRQSRPGTGADRGPRRTRAVGRRSLLQ